MISITGKKCTLNAEYGVSNIFEINYVLISFFFFPLSVIQQFISMLKMNTKRNKHDKIAYTTTVCHLFDGLNEYTRMVFNSR